MKVFVRTLLLIPLVLATGGSVARAQIDLASGPGRRVLAKHQFQYTDRIVDPFVTTHVRTSTGAGIATGFESVLEGSMNNNDRDLEGSLAFYALDFEYQKNLFDWWALKINAGGSGRTGINGESVIADGVTTLFGVNLLAKARVWEGDHSQVSAFGSFARKNVIRLDIEGFAQEVIDAGEVPEGARIFEEGDIHRFSFGGSGAHAFSRALGAMGFFELGSAKPVLDELDSEFLYRGGVSADYDFLPHQDFPVGVLLSYFYDSYPEGGIEVSDGVHGSSLGLSYTGRQDLYLGLSTVVSTVQQSDSDSSLASTLFRFDLVYYF